MPCGDSGAGRRSRGALCLTRSWTPVPLAEGATSCNPHQQRTQPSAIPPGPRCSRAALLRWLTCVEGTAVFRSSALSMLCSHQPSLPTQLGLIFGDDLMELTHQNLVSHAWVSTCPFCRCAQCQLLGGSVCSCQIRSVPSQGWITQSQKVWLGKTLKDHLVPTLCHGTPHTKFRLLTHIKHLMHKSALRWPPEGGKDGLTCPDPE